uniref:IS110 family transposase n=1 Tax=Janibacter limosus TaxID=53458 RepID=A0AC61U449_9MICO
MQSATSTTLPETPLNDVTAGIDWAVDDHAACIVDGRGREIARVMVEHTTTGLRDPVIFPAKHGVDEVAIERPDGPIIDVLLEAELTVVVISPNRVKNLRGRYGSAGNKDDRFDAFVLADTLRTDRARLRRLEPDTRATTALRRACRTRKDLVAHRVAAANQLRAHLSIVFPGAVGLFADLDSEISPAFIARFDTQERADWLSPARLGKWLASVGYSGRTDPAVLHAHLTRAPGGLTGPAATAEAGSTHAMIALLTTPVEQIKIPGPPDRRPARRPRRRAHLHQPAPLRTRTRRPAAGRDRRLPRQVPHPRIPGLHGRRRALDPTIRQDARRRLPLGLRQATARRRHRLRRRQPTRQPLGRRPLRPVPSPRTRSRPRRAHPRPRLGSTSSGTAGKTTLPTTPTSTTRSNAS